LKASSGPTRQLLALPLWLPLLLACTAESPPPFQDGRREVPSFTNEWFPVHGSIDAGRDAYRSGPTAPSPLETGAVPYDQQLQVLLGSQRRLLLVDSVIGPDGRIACAKILNAPSPPEADRIVAEALRGWRFAPALLKGARVPMYWTLTIELAHGD
jgi:hypothetical protein